MISEGDSVSLACIIDVDGHGKEIYSRWKSAHPRKGNNIKSDEPNPGQAHKARIEITKGSIS